MAAITIAQLIDQAKTLRKTKTAHLFVPSLNGEITIEEPDMEIFSEALGLAKGNDEYLIYNCITSPNLRDPELQKAYGCTEPTDIVRKIFTPGEVVKVSRQILDLGGYNDTVRVVEEIKN